MKIVPVKIEFKTLYEHRHLYTDDVQYNSLIISNLINQSIMLINIDDYEKLDDKYKYAIARNAKDNLENNHILFKAGLYQIHINFNAPCFKWRQCQLFNGLYDNINLLSIME